MAKATNKADSVLKSQEMTLSKSTKGTHVYTCDDEDTFAPTVYIKRSALPKDPPETIKLAIKFEE